MGVVLLTGGLGFVGRQVLRKLLERGIQVRLVVRKGKQEELVPVEITGPIVTTPDLFSEGVDWWAEVCSKIDTVIHCAWYADPADYLLSPRNLDCLIGTLRLAQGVAKAGVRRFVGIGTSVEYELSAGMLSVDTPLRPSTPYGGAKAAAFTMLSQWLPTQKVGFAWCRLFNLYGEGEDVRRLVPYLRAKLSEGELAELTSGSQVRDFLDVATAGDMIADFACGSQQGAVNICSGVPVTVRELAERLADEYGRRDLLRLGARKDNPLEAQYVVGVKNSL